MFVPGLKLIDDDTIKGYMLVWGSPDEPDAHKQFFTPRTDWMEPLATPRPLTLWHGLPDWRPPIVGKVFQIGEDEIGRWYRATLNKASEYRKLIQHLIEQGRLASSPDSMPQYFAGRPAARGTFEITRFPVVCVSLTDTPAQFQLLGEDAPIVRTPGEKALIDSVKRWQWVRSGGFAETLQRFDELKAWARKSGRP